MSELNGSGKKLNQPGMYRHKDTGVEIHLEATEGIGTPLIDAFVQAGFVPVTDQKAVVVSEAPATPEVPVTPEVPAPAEVPSEPKPEQDVYTESVTKTGMTQYRKNGQLISKEVFDANKQKEA